MRLDPPDLNAARRWLERAVEAGYRDAMFNLGVLYAELMDPPDLIAACGWFERAAKAGDSDAMTNLGHVYTEWMDPPDLEAARTWYENGKLPPELGLWWVHALFVLGVILAFLLPRLRRSWRARQQPA